MVRARVTPQMKSSTEAILKKLGISSTESIPFEISLEVTDNKRYYTKVKSPEHLKQCVQLMVGE